MKIFYVNGIARSGKDTFVDACAKFGDVLKTSTVDEVKQIARRSFGWDGVKDEGGRKLLASLRSVWGEYNNGPIKSTKAMLDIVQPDVAFIMVREFPEMMKMKELMGGETLLVVRAGLEVGETEQMFLDMVPADFEYDHGISNNGNIDDLKSKALAFMKEMT